MLACTVSGIQTSGRLQLGNYLGAIRHWVHMQDQEQCFLFLADLHSISVPRLAEELRASIIHVAAVYLACGLDPKKVTLFQQSDVPAHSELAWLFSCLTPCGWLNRMTQFKDKAGKHRDQAMLALYSYPVLQAADILIYKATQVPVGEDQKQHVELTRDIAGTFNNRYEQPFFPLPEPMILGEATRVMSLRDGTKKMSKSDPSDMSRINMDDDPDTIMQKIKKAKSDPEPISSDNLENRPELSNLLTIFAACTHQDKNLILTAFEGKGFSEFKSGLADAVISELKPIYEKYQALMKEPAYIHDVLKYGAEHANEIASKNLAEVKDIMGFSRKNTTISKHLMER